MFFVWVILTLAMASVAAIIAKRYGVEYIIALVAAMSVIANILSSAKMATFISYAIDAGTIVYASIYLLTDILCEFYGKEEAKKAVWAGFMANAMLAVSLWIAIAWEPAGFWHKQKELIDILGSTPRIIFASMAAYLISQHHDIWLYSILKRMTKGRYLWLRNNASTMLSQLIDTTIFSFIAFYGKYPVIPLITGVYIVKLIVAASDTAFIYAIKGYWKAKSGHS